MPDAMTIRRQTVEHTFGTLKLWMGAAHFLTKTLKNVRTEMSLQVLAYNMKRMINMFGVKPLIAVMGARRGEVKNIASLLWMRTQRQSSRSRQRVFPRTRPRTDVGN
jgi:hypothetical protein